MTIIIWMWWIKGLVGGMSVTAEDASLCFIYLCVTQLLAQTPPQHHLNVCTANTT